MERRVHERKRVPKSQSVWARAMWCGPIGPMTLRVYMQTLRAGGVPWATIAAEAGVTVSALHKLRVRTPHRIARRGPVAMPPTFPAEAHTRTASEWATACGVLVSTVSMWARAAGVAMRPSRPADSSKPANFAAEAHTRTALEWARLCGVTRQTVYTWARRDGVQVRGRAVTQPGADARSG